MSAIERENYSLEGFAGSMVTPTCGVSSMMARRLPPLFVHLQRPGWMLV
jgi:hypothetical protein